MNAGKWIFTVIFVLCGIVMIMIGLYQRRSSVPAKLNSSEDLDPEEIRNIPDYNRKHGLMFIVYGAVIIGGVFLSWIFSSQYSAVIAMIACILPIPFLPKYHNYLLQQHQK